MSAADGIEPSALRLGAKRHAADLSVRAAFMITIITSSSNEECTICRPQLNCLTQYSLHDERATYSPWATEWPAVFTFTRSVAKLCSPLFLISLQTAFI